jgi:hypothetical protein
VVIIDFYLEYASIAVATQAMQRVFYITADPGWLEFEMENQVRYRFAAQPKHIARVKQEV